MAKKYIDCEALIDALMSYSWRDENDFSIDDADEKRKYIEGWLPNIPAADVAEVLHGHWIQHKEYNDDYDQYDEWCNCSECCFRATAVNKTPYCPHCGAKMDKSEDEEL